MDERTTDICTIQPSTEAAPVVYATYGHDTSVLLVSHAAPTPGEDYGEPLAVLWLTPDGWTTLVELYAMRRPEAFARIVETSQALAAARGR